MNLVSLLAGGLIGAILALIGRYIYDLKVQPKVEKSRRRAEKLENEREEEAKRARLEQEVLRRNDIQALRDLKGFLEPLGSMFQFPNSYDPQACYKLLGAIRGKAELIKRSEFQLIREKFLKFSDKKESLNASLARSELLNIITGKYDLLHPQDLINDINTILADAQK